MHITDANTNIKIDFQDWYNKNIMKKHKENYSQRKAVQPQHLLQLLEVVPVVEPAPVEPVTSITMT